MLEQRLRIAADELEEALDAVLPALPGGLHERREGDEVELRILDLPGTPDGETLRRLAGPALIDLTSAEVSDDWRERRLERYEPLVVADRFLLRPDWAPGQEGSGLTEIVLRQGPAFGTGAHPTTHACLALLAELEPGGSLADYGCGSGVLSIAAAKLGWSPVTAIDIDRESVAVARENAATNEVELDVRRVDLTVAPAPEAQTVVANIPPDVQIALTEAISFSPRLVITSGFKAEDGERVAAAWAALGLSVDREHPAMEWSAMVLR